MIMKRCYFSTWQPCAHHTYQAFLKTHPLVDLKAPCNLFKYLKFQWVPAATRVTSPSQFNPINSLSVLKGQETLERVGAVGQSNSLLVGHYWVISR